MNSTYAYQDTNRQTVMIDESNVNFTGTWSSSGTYVATDYDAVVYGASKYIAIVDNVGGVPTYVPRRGQAKWSSLVLIRQGTNSGGHTADEAYALALEAMDAADAALLVADQANVFAEDANVAAGVALVTAWAGTSAAETALGTALGVAAGVDAAISIASTGTNLGRSAEDHAYAAMQTAWSGTNGANAAMSVAVRGTNAAAIAEVHSLIALQTAWAGTAAANQALPAANQALTAAWAGTAAANQALPIANQALQTGWAGTAAAAAADAHAQTALVTAWTGTQTANLVASWFGTLPNVNALAQQGSQFSVILRDQGTHYTDDQVRISSQQDGQFAFDLFVAGTNYTNAQAFSAGSATSLAVYWAGTTYTDARVAAEAAARIAGDNLNAAARIAGDNQIFAVAVQGTNAANLADIHANKALQTAWAGTNNSVPLAGGTMTGNLRTPQIFLNSGSVGIGALQNGTMYYDFLGPAFVETQVDANMTVSAKNFTPGAEIAVCLVSNGQQKAISYDAQFSFFGTQMPYTSPTAGKKILIPLASTGTVASKVLGATQPQL